jgi:poly-gamma-glutamate synthesis protein (capsule biosynthesis protein)
VHAASRQDDVVVVYMHWGEELQGCPTTQQHITAQALARAGADIVVGSHAHVLLGAGWLDHTYVDYGLGNFLWYHNEEPETGVLRLTVRDGEVVGDSWVPARIHTHGRPHPLSGPARGAAVAHWQALRGCTGLTPRSATSRGPASDHHPPPTAFTATVRTIGPGLRDRMQYSHHHPGCPVPLTDLRYLQMTYLGFDGSAHTGEMVVHKTYAADIVDVFHQLYDAQWPIQQMRLVDAYRGDDERSMAANNTSGYNCRHVAGTHTWSAHAYGTAIDINPAQNPYLTTTAIHPPSAARYAHINRTPTARHLPPGAIQAGDIVVRAFNHIGWQWGGQWPNPKDFQHFSAPPLWAR